MLIFPPVCVVHGEERQWEGSGRLHGGDQTVDGLDIRCEGIRGCIAPCVDHRAADRAVSVGRSIHGRQCATRLLVQGCADLAGSVPLGQISDHAAAKDIITVQSSELLGATPDRASLCRLPRPDTSPRDPCGKRSSRPSIRHYPMTHLQRVSQLHGIAYTL